MGLAPPQAGSDRLAQGQARVLLRRQVCGDHKGAHRDDDPRQHRREHHRGARCCVRLCGALHATECVYVRAPLAKPACVLGGCSESGQCAAGCDVTLTGVRPLALVPPGAARHDRASTRAAECVAGARPPPITAALARLRWVGLGRECLPSCKGSAAAEGPQFVERSLIKSARGVLIHRCPVVGAVA